MYCKHPMQVMAIIECVKYPGFKQELFRSSVALQKWNKCQLLFYNIIYIFFFYNLYNLYNSYIFFNGGCFLNVCVCVCVCMCVLGGGGGVKTVCLLCLGNYGPFNNAKKKLGFSTCWMYVQVTGFTLERRTGVGYPTTFQFTIFPY